MFKRLKDWWEHQKACDAKNNLALEKDLNEMVTNRDKESLLKLIDSDLYGAGVDAIYIGGKSLGECLIEKLRIPVQKKWWQENFNEAQKQIIKKYVMAL